MHGDFGPQNILLDHDLRKVVALLDWERIYLGDPVEDLAWAEWIVRRHLPEAVRHLDALFAGYGDTPPWHGRKRAVLAACRQHLEGASQLDERGVAPMWRERLHWTEGLLG